ncbi:RelA/SpoT domain-containing protein [Piscinibacter koreensis]|uniref:RelA/SpoT domain-containing protein n=1 Tax=Piscinibacter koreensis TaxID=2742824 RepID=A0A7Y6NMQ0_9BURK|nr:RelA/SpoT domain-containing protein [Schlegelella koreensis]NUZ05979.1 RelA/SpoT domain-containing protein [Schlegelella koreensis]
MADKAPRTVPFPGGSKSAVNRAGEAVRAERANQADYDRINEWRAAHSVVLNTFQVTLRRRTRGSQIFVAQRHKRRKTIFDKLQREPDMALARMDDIAGCRLIFPTVLELYGFRSSFHSARFKHRLRNGIDKYDYIKNPKASGYRGIHDVYEYDVDAPPESASARCAGLYVEIQYRTLVQHAWATANEVVGQVTSSQPKFQLGDARYLRFMSLASEVLARTMEGLKGPCADLTNDRVVAEFKSLDKELGLLDRLKLLDELTEEVSQNKNMILMFLSSYEVQIFNLSSEQDAMDSLFELETRYPDRDIVLVRADSTDSVRLAFQNYFSDATEFIQFVETGVAQLSAA